MKLSDALNLLHLTGDNLTLAQCQVAYRRACMKWHPDRNPGGLEMMKAVNAAWAYLQTLDWDRPVNNAKTSDANYGDALNAAINAVIDLEGIDLEICGAWLWISGNTYPHRATLKGAGFTWASKKKMWYFRPTEWASSNRGAWDMDHIRSVHGTASVSRPFADHKGRTEDEDEPQRLRA